MKRIMVLSLAIALVLAFYTVAFAQLASEKVDVTLNILPHAELIVPEVIDFGDIGYADGFTATVIKKTFKLKTNCAVKFHLKSVGFGVEPLDKYQNWVAYIWEQQNGNRVGAPAGGTRGAYPLNYTGDVIEIPFEARIKPRSEDWYKVEAGEWSDILELTVWVDQ